MKDLLPSFFRARVSMGVLSALGVNNRSTEEPLLKSRARDDFCSPSQIPTHFDLFFTHVSRSDEFYEAKCVHEIYAAFHECIGCRCKPFFGPICESGSPTGPGPT